MEIVVGIDFGTSNSAISGIIQGTSQIIPDAKGNRITPSIVSFGRDKQIVIGVDAKMQLLKNPKRTIHSIKRLIGRKYFSSEVQKSKALLPFEIIEDPNQNPMLVIDDLHYSPQEVAALILRHMKTIAEEGLKMPVKKCVITVPAYFNDAQRQTTKEACEIAGLELLRMINEPTAAALAYGFGKKKNEKIAVYDLGGGTFDISILHLRNDVFEVISTAGDTFLGGDDIDDRIIDLMAEDFLRKNQVDLRALPGALPLLRANAEKTKRRLSYAERSDVYIPGVLQKNAKSVDLHFTLSRDQLKSSCMDLIQKTFAVCDEALQSARLKTSDLDAIIMVGGPTKMPMIQEAVEIYFGQKALSHLNPDEVVSIGASIQAQALVADAHSRALLLDVTPLDLGVATVGGYTETLIEKNSQIPAANTKVFTTTKDNQEAVDIRVFQGQHRKESDSILLGEFHLKGIRKARAGEVALEVAFDINQDGLVHVSARDRDTGVAHEISVKFAATAGKQRVQEMAKKANEHKEVRLKDELKDCAKLIFATPQTKGGRCMYQEAFVNHFDPFSDTYSLMTEEGSSSQKVLERKNLQWILQVEDFANTPRYLQMFHTPPEAVEKSSSKHPLFEFRFKNGEKIYGRAALVGANDVGFWIEPDGKENDLPGRLFVFSPALEDHSEIHASACSKARKA